MKAISLVLLLSLVSCGVIKKHREKTKEHIESKTEIEFEQESIDLLPIKVPGQIQTFLFDLDSLRLQGVQYRQIGSMHTRVTLRENVLLVESGTDTTEVQIPRKVKTKVSVKQQTESSTHKKTVDQNSSGHRRRLVILYLALSLLVIYIIFKKRHWLWSLFARFL